MSFPGPSSGESRVIGDPNGNPFETPEPDESSPGGEVPRLKWWPRYRVEHKVFGHDGLIKCVSFQRGSLCFATGSNDMMVKLWSAENCQELRKFVGHQSAVRGLTFSRTEIQTLFSSGDESHIKCWDVERRRCTRQFTGIKYPQHALAMTPGDGLLVSAGRGYLLYIWDPRSSNAKMVRTLGTDAHSGSVNRLVCQASEPRLISASEDKKVKLWDLRMGRPLANLQGEAPVRALCLRPGKAVLAANAAGGRIAQWCSLTGKQLRVFEGHGGSSVNCLAVNEDGALVSGAEDGSMALFDFRTGEKMQHLKDPGTLSAEDVATCRNPARIFDVAFDDSGSKFVATGADMHIRLFTQDEESVN